MIAPRPTEPSRWLGGGRLLSARIGGARVWNPNVAVEGTEGREFRNDARVAIPPGVYFPQPEPLHGFPRWGFLLWLLYYVEDQLAKLPSLLLGPTLGAVIGTSVAVSELGTVRVDGVLAAAPVSVWAVLWPALLGGVGGVAVLSGFWGLVGTVSYFACGGDSAWTPRVREPSAVELLCKPGSPLGPLDLGGGCVVRFPSKRYEGAGGISVLPGEPGVMALGLTPLTGPGTYLIRWYGTEGRGRSHEVARMKHAAG